MFDDTINWIEGNPDPEYTKMSRDEMGRASDAIKNCYLKIKGIMRRQNQNE